MGRWLSLLLLHVGLIALVACSPGTPVDSGSATPAGAGASSAPAAILPTALLPSSQTQPTVLEATGSEGIAPVRSVPGELLVKFRTGGRGPSVLAAADDRIQVQSVRTFRSVPGLQRIRLAPGVSVQQALDAYTTRSDVEYAERNYIVSTHAIPNDPSFPNQWALNNTGQIAGAEVDSDIDATDAWDITTGSPNVYVAVIDSGVDYTHPDLAPNIYSSPADCNTNGVDDDLNGYADDCHGIDTANDDSDPMDDEGHGTHVAGIVGAQGNNGLGVSGVAWSSKILPCKFIDEAGSGTVGDAIACLDYVATMKARGLNIVATNNSWGVGINSLALRDAIERQLQAGILFVAAAGNDYRNLSDTWAYEDGALFPCAYTLPNIICVGNTKANDDQLRFLGGSNYGRQNVHVMAPGTDVLSTWPGGLYATLTGTSMATPHVAGTVALLYSAFPAIDWREARNRILASGDISQYLEFNGHEHLDVVTKRRLNAARSLTCSNLPVAGRMSPRTVGQVMSDVQVGMPLTLTVLNINCGSPNGTVTITGQPGNLTLTLLDNGLAEDAVAGDGVYTGAWTPAAGGSYTFAFPGTVYDLDSSAVIPDTITVNVDDWLKPGFPVRTLHTGGSFLNFPAPVAGNADGDPDLEILLAGFMQGPNYMWKANGALVPGWPLDPDSYDPLDGIGVQSPGFWSMGNLVGAPDELELVGGFQQANALSPIEARFGTGALLPNWPRVAGNIFAHPATLVDIDADGRDEIFWSASWSVLVGARADGSAVFGADVSTMFSPLGPAFAGDLDLDGTPELVVRSDNTSSGEIIALRADGIQVPGFPVPTEHPPRLSGIGDVDGDGKPEIIALTGRATPSGSEAVLIQVGADGTVRRTIPVPPAVPLDGLADLDLDALADLDADGIPEMVLSYGIVDNFFHTERRFITVLRGDGTVLPGWPRELTKIREGLTSLAVVGDVNGDGQPDVVQISQTQLHALSPDGTYVSGFPRQLPAKFVFGTFGIAYTPIIADIDRDGRNDIIAVTSYSSGRAGWFDRVWAFEAPGAAAHGPIEWGHEREGASHRGFYELGKNLPTQAYLATRAQGNGTIVAQGGGINCGVDCIERYTKGTAVTLSANAGSGESFLGWRGACAGQPNPCTVTLQRFTSVVAEFTAPPIRALTVNVTGSGRGIVSSQPDQGPILCPVDCYEQFGTNTTVTLRATPNAGSQFDGWSGACTGTATTCTVSVDTARTVTANFTLRSWTLTVARAGTGTGSVTSVPAGINCGADCSESYIHATQVVLTAAPASGSTFTGWTGSGACVSTSPTCSVSMFSGQSITANFSAGGTPGVPLTVIVSGSGNGTVTSQPAGISCPGDCTESTAVGATITLTATPDAISTFGGWTGACAVSGTTCTVTMSSARTVSAIFNARTWPLTVTRAGTGSGRIAALGGIDCGQSCSTTYAHGTTVVLNAYAESNSVFAGWSGACTGTASTCTVPMTAATAVTATFTLKPVLSVTRSGTGNGRVSSAPDGIDCGTDCSQPYTSGTVVVLTAFVPNDALFAGWSGGCAGATLTCEVTVDAAKTVNAQFTQRTMLTVVMSGAGTVSTNPPGMFSCAATSCSSPFDPGALVTLTATASTGYTFSGWSGACSGGSATCSVTMDAAKAVTATFAPVGGGNNGGGNNNGGSGGGGGGRLDWLWLGLLALATTLRFASRSIRPPVPDQRM